MSVNRYPEVNVHLDVSGLECCAQDDDAHSRKAVEPQAGTHRLSRGPLAWMAFIAGVPTGRYVDRTRGLPTAHQETLVASPRSAALGEYQYIVPISETLEFQHRQPEWQLAHLLQHGWPSRLCSLVCGELHARQSQMCETTSMAVPKVQEVVKIAPIDFGTG